MTRPPPKSGSRNLFNESFLSFLRRIDNKPRLAPPIYHLDSPGGAEELQEKRYLLSEGHEFLDKTKSMLVIAWRILLHLGEGDQEASQEGSQVNLLSNDTFLIFILALIGWLKNPPFKSSFPRKLKVMFLASTRIRQSYTRKLRFVGYISHFSSS
jgi:hypothetical protein